MLKPSIHSLGKQSGMAFIWILVLLVIVSTLSLSFLQKAVIGTSATVSRESAMKTQYLARSAANHALWRLLNDPTFAPTETDYDMHDFGDGRYGYKVRKPTLTQFGTVATVGAVGDVVTKQSYVQYLKPYNIITTYEPNGGAVIPVFRRLLGATWVDPAGTLSVGPNDAQWMVLKGCPIRKEMIMGTLDSANDINFAVWDGVSWGNLTEFTQDTWTSNLMAFDIAYENQSGDALVVGRYDDWIGVRYNIWNGTAWVFATPQEDVNLSPEAELSYVDMASKPNSDEILIAEVQFDKDLKVVQWDGASFNDLGEIDDNMAKDDYGSAAIVYEQQSGDALIIWNHKNSSQLYYSIWNGTVLSGPAVAPLNFGGIPYVIRAAPDPDSDTIFVAAVDKSYDLNVAVWDGGAWTESRELSTNVNDNSSQILDVAWEQSGANVMVAWGDSSGGNNVQHYTWQKGTALAAHAVQSGPDCQAEPSLIRLHPIANTEKIILLVSNTSRDLRYSLWTGDKFLGDPGILLNSDLGAGLLPFDIAESVAP